MTAPILERDPDPDASSPDASSPDPDDLVGGERMFLGVAGLIADALDVDTLWVRLGFVLLGLAGGVGVVLYLGLWLALIGPRSAVASWPQYLGGAVVVAGVPLMIAAVDVNFATGQLAVLALLVALAVVLWQPRRDRSVRRSSSAPPLPPPTPTNDDAVVSMELAALVVDVDTVTTSGIDPERSATVPPAPERVRRRRARRPRREPSALGRLTLGLAVIVAGAGALIDQVNGGRLHPEQWLGAAAVVCGIGLLVGAVRGHGRWLIVPAIAFAGAGYVTGVLAGVGIDLAAVADSGGINISEEMPGGQLSTSTGFGQLWIGVDSAPADQVVVDARIGFGNVDISANDIVALEVHTDIGRGDARLNGVVQAGEVVRFGPDREPDVIILARVGVGDVNIGGYDTEFVEGQSLIDGLGPFDPLVAAHGLGTQVTDGVGVSTDGWIVLAGGEALIDRANRVVVGDVGPGVPRVILTDMGPFLLEGDMLTTPTGEVFGLEDLRAMYTDPSTMTTDQPAPIPPLEPAPSTTVAPPPTIVLGPITDPTIGG